MPLDISQLENFKEYGSKAEAQCPACFEMGQDKSGNHLFIKPDGSFGCVANPGDKDHRRRIAELAGLDDKAQRPVPAPTPMRQYRAPGPSPKGKRMITVETPYDHAYGYQDASGQLSYIVRRYVDPKDFRPFKWVSGEFVMSMEGVERLPYRLPELIKSPSIWIVEGEKDADNLVALGIPATCRAGGSSKWEAELTDWFKGKDVVLCGDNDAPGQKYMQEVENALKPVAKSIKRAKVPDPHKDISDALEGLGDGEAHALLQALLVDPMTVTLETRRFDVTRPPVRTEPVLWIGDAGIAKPGDLVVIQAQVKSGKSSLLAAMMGCLMGAGRLDCDFLGIRGVNPNGLPVLHIDTEQTPEDHYDMIMRTLKRAGLDEPPAWFHSYCLVELSIDERRKALRFEVERLMALHGSLASIFLDGSADLVHDVNDAAEANAFVDELFTLAIRCRAPLLSVVHENHGSEDGKQRGHLGSQLMRKAASNLRLSKGDNGVIQLWGEKLRRGYIGKGTGPHFIWDDERGMHISCETSKTTATTSKDRAKSASLLEMAGDVFSGTVSSLRYAHLKAAIMKREGCSERTAARQIDAMKQFGIVKVFNFIYSLNHDFEV